MAERIDLESMKRQLEPLINEKRVTELDCLAVQTLALLDIADSLRQISSNTERRFFGGPG